VKEGKKKTVLYTDEWKDVYSWVEPSERGELYTRCSVCRSDMATFRRGLTDLHRHFVTKKHRKQVQLAPRGGGRVAEPTPPCSEATALFINKYCSPGGGTSPGDLPSDDFPRHMLGLQLAHVSSVCQQTPYCLYVYGGVALGEAAVISVVLVGFFHVESATHRVRLLDVLPSPVGGEMEGEQAKQEGEAVVETLKRFDLPLTNLSAVYTHGNGGTSSAQICSQLRELSPNLVALGGLYTVADSACHAAVSALSSPVQEILSELHAYYTSTSTDHECLNALFAPINHPDGAPLCLSTNCLIFSAIVRKMLEVWPDLVSLFSSGDKDDEKDQVQSICVKLQDANLKTTFKFLALALKPLEAFQKHLQTHDGHERVDLVLVLQVASSLLNTYASDFLNPQAVARFLEERDPCILTNTKFHLSGANLLVGGSSAEDLLSDSPSADALPTEQIMSFYVTLTGHIAEVLPLSDGMLRNIAQLLNPESRLHVTEKGVEELGRKLGVCSSPEEAKQLTKEFLEYQQAGEEQSDAGEENTDSAAISLERHWAGVLKDGASNSVLRRLVLSLLSFPCPPLQAQRVFAQVRECQRITPFACCNVVHLHYIYIQGIWLTLLSKATYKEYIC